jgi:type I site-specific restriction endonuclease
VQLNFPTYALKLRTAQDKQEVWDVVRKIWVVLTPEEWVRQHAIHYLNKECGCPLGLLSVEKGLKVNGMYRRSDIVVHNAAGMPALLVECKAPEVKLTPAVFDQAARYNLQLKVPFLLITNGMIHFCCRVDHETGTISHLTGLPMFEEL